MKSVKLEIDPRCGVNQNAFLIHEQGFRTFIYTGNIQTTGKRGERSFSLRARVSSIRRINKLAEGSELPSYSKTDPIRCFLYVLMYIWEIACSEYLIRSVFIIISATICGHIDTRV